MLSSVSKLLGTVWLGSYKRSNSLSITASSSSLHFLIYSPNVFILTQSIWQIYPNVLNYSISHVCGAKNQVLWKSWLYVGLCDFLISTSSNSRKALVIKSFHQKTQGELMTLWTEIPVVEQPVIAPFNWRFIVLEIFSWHRFLIVKKRIRIISLYIFPGKDILCQDSTIFPVENRKTTMFCKVTESPAEKKALAGKTAVVTFRFYYKSHISRVRLSIGINKYN